MTAIADKIMTTVRRHGRGTRVYSARDFLAMGARAGVDQALSRLVKAGTLRRVARGLYDWPSHSTVLKRDIPADTDAVVGAIERRANLTASRDGLAAANAFGLTPAVPTKPAYVISGNRRPDLRIGGRLIEFKVAGTKLAPWLDSEAAPIVQALMWARKRRYPLNRAIVVLREKASAAQKAALARDMYKLPDWALEAAREIVENR